MSCKRCQRDVPIENDDTGLCGTCNRKDRDQDSELYPLIKAKFLQKMVEIDAYCPITGAPITMDSDVHHMKGRIGYADEWARDNDISLLIDVRFFLAVSRAGHTWIENNTAEALQKGYSLTRQDTHNG